VNGKLYIGQTKQSPNKRFYAHKLNLRTGKHTNKHLQSAWDKYGESAFEFSILDKVVFLESLNNLERFWIKHKNTTNPKFGYNKTSGGETGKVVSPESVKKRKLTMVGYWTAERRADMSAKKKGCKGVNNGRKFDEEFSKKQSRIKTKYGVEALNIATGEKKEFFNAVRAAAYFNIHKSSVYMVCKGKTKQCYGWTFKHINSAGGY
jgi:group I intron endonuclease